MNFIVIGSGGGLGSYLVREFLSSGFKAFGIDIYEGEFVTHIIDQNESSSMKNIIAECLDKFNGPTSIIISVAPKGRLKSKTNCKNIKSEILKYFNIDPSIITDAGDCLAKTAFKYQGESHIIYIGSILSDRYSSAENPAYGASKAACKSLVRDLSFVLMDKNICVNSISPALLYRNDNSLKFLLKRLKYHPSNCSPTSYSDIYKLTHFICSSGIKSLRGKNIVLDHGLESIESFDLLNRD